MSDSKFHEQILISVALVLCAAIVCYNFFFVPSLSPATIVYVDKKENNQKPEEDETIECSDELININLASADELSDALPGVGKVTAERIVEFRESNGKFESVDDLINVKGIGEKSLEKIRPLICV